MEFLRSTTSRRPAWALACSGLLLFGAAATTSFAESSMFRYSPTHAAALASASVELAGMAWRFETGGAVRSTPAVSAGTIVFGSNDGNLYALDLKTGVQKWKVRFGGEVSGSPAIFDGKIIAMGADGRLHALKLEDGSEVWTLATGADASFGPDPRGFDIWGSSPTIVDGVIYTGSGDGKVRAIALTTGKERWAFSTQHRVRSAPAVVDGILYVGSFDGNVYALDAATGAQRWKYQTGDAVQSSPAVANGRVYIGLRAMAVIALDAKTGALQWRRPHSGSWILASPAVADGKVIIGGSDSHLLEALDETTGAPVWSVSVGARMLGSPTIVGQTILYAAEDFRIYTADLATGLGRSIDAMEAAVYGSVVLAGDKALVGCDDRHLYAFNVRPVTALKSTATPELLASAVGKYRTEPGDELTVTLQQGHLRIDYCTYPPSAVFLQADGSFVCPMLWGISGRIQGQPGQPARALALSMFGRDLTAQRIE